MVFLADIPAGMRGRELPHTPSRFFTGSSGISRGCARTCSWQGRTGPWSLGPRHEAGGTNAHLKHEAPAQATSGRCLAAAGKSEQAAAATPPPRNRRAGLRQAGVDLRLLVTRMPGAAVIAKVRRLVVVHAVGTGCCRRKRSGTGA